MDDNFGQAYLDECDDWRNRYEESKMDSYDTKKCPICGCYLSVDEEQMASDYGSAYWNGVLDEEALIYYCENCEDDYGIVGSYNEILEKAKELGYGN